MSKKQQWKFQKIQKPTYSQHLNPNQTPQTQPISGKKQVQGQGGGYVFAVDDWMRLQRFLILGSEGGTYYAKARELTIENAKSVVNCIQTEGVKVVDIVKEISTQGRAPKADPAIFVLALCAKFGDLACKKAAREAFNQIIRTGTHLFQFNQEVSTLRGNGRWLRTVNKNWYQQKTAEEVAYQAVKYQQRHGWSHRDLLRLFKPKPIDIEHNAVYRWIAKGEMLEGLPRVIEGFEKLRNQDKTINITVTVENLQDLPKVIEGLEKLKTTHELNPKQAVALIREYNLPRETVPTELLNSAEVWEALLADMKGKQLTALIRNLGKMSEVGLLKPLSNAAHVIVERLNDEKMLKDARLHPIAVLMALKTYAQGHGERGKLTWQPVREVIDACNEAFYKTFRQIKPTHKRIMLALDVSGSMEGSYINNTSLSAREGSAAMAMVTARTESNYVVTGFTSAGQEKFVSKKGKYGTQNPISELTISPKQRLDDIVKKISGLDFGGTDCALPMLYARERGLEIDTFVIYTDSETWAGDIHPCQALQQYRDAMGIPAKLIVVGMTSNGFSIADPNDAGMLDIVGFDTATPAIMSDFIAVNL